MKLRVIETPNNEKFPYYIVLLKLPEDGVVKMEKKYFSFHTT